MRRDNTYVDIRFGQLLSKIIRKQTSEKKVDGVRVYSDLEEKPLVSRAYVFKR